MRSLMKDYDVSSGKIEEANRIKFEHEKMQNELNSIKKTSKEEYDRLVKENSKNLEYLENDKYDEIKKVESQLKSQLEKLKQKISEKDKEIKEYEQQNNLLKSQIEILDNNILTSKQSWVESK